MGISQAIFHDSKWRFIEVYCHVKGYIPIYQSVMSLQITKPVGISKWRSEELLNVIDSLSDLWPDALILLDVNGLPD